MNPLPFTRHEIRLTKRQQEKRERLATIARLIVLVGLLAIVCWKMGILQ